MAFIEAYTASQNPQLNQRVRVALMQYADQVAQEPPNTVNHSNRIILIGRIMSDINQFADLFTVYATAVSGISESSDDASILAAVEHAWTNFAGNI